MRALPRSLFSLISAFLLAVNTTGVGTGAFGRIDAQQPTVSPTLASSSFFGGNGRDEITGVAVDPSGNIYLAGNTTSTNLPVSATAFQTSLHGSAQDSFVAKLDPTASTILYLTYLGGSNTEYANAIAVDSGGNAYVVGTTDSLDFPVTLGAAQIRFGGADIFGDAFIVKLDPTGSTLVYGTYLGGSRDDLANAIVLDAAGAAYVAGSARSRDFPVTPGAFQPVYGGDQGVYGSGGDGFVAKLNPSGTQFEFVTYLGGSSEDRVSSIALDGSGNVVVAGTTSSPDFPATAGVVQPRYAGTGSDPTTGGDAFLTKLSPLGDTLIFSTFLGGSGSDGASTVELDSAGNLYLQGSTRSTDFPTFHPLQASLAGQSDAFLVKLNPTATSLIYSSYLGGSGSEWAAGTIDTQGNVYLSGYTDSADFPTLNGVQPYLGDTDTYVAKVDATGSILVYSSYLGGGSPDYGGVIARDPAGNLWLAGETWSQNFPTRNAIQSQWNGGDWDGFLARVTETSPPPVESTADLSVTVISDKPTIQNGNTLHFTVNVTNHGPSVAEDVRLTQTLPYPLNFDSANATQGSCTSDTGVTCNLGALSVNQTAGATITAKVPDKPGNLGGTLSVTAGVLSSTTDPDVTNNSAHVNLILATSGGGGPGSSGCFIATAAYGSYLDPHVQVLRTFRDRRLLTIPLGRAFVRAYYRYSPAAATLIARSEFSRRVVRCMLAPLIFAIEYPTSILYLILVCAFSFLLRHGARRANPAPS